MAATSVCAAVASMNTEVRPARTASRSASSTPELLLDMLDMLDESDEPMSGIWVSDMSMPREPAPISWLMM
jgi:hypothetical protein